MMLLKADLFFFHFKLIIHVIVCIEKYNFLRLKKCDICSQTGKNASHDFIYQVSGLLRNTTISQTLFSQ